MTLLLQTHFVQTPMTQSLLDLNNPEPVHQQPRHMLALLPPHGQFFEHLELTPISQGGNFENCRNRRFYVPDALPVDNQQHQKSTARSV